MMRYDKHLWKAKTYSTPEEIRKGLRSFRLKNKVIKRVDFIGVSRIDTRIFPLLYNAGVPFKCAADLEKQWEHTNDRSLPCEAELCEPIVITFEDNTTFEFLPMPGGALKMSVNQLSGGMMGLNHKTADATKLFRQLVGARIDHVTVRHFTMEEYNPYSTRTTYRYTFQFYTAFSETRDFGENCGFELSYRCGAWYTVRLTDQCCFFHEGNVTAKIKYGDLRKALIPSRQIEIIEGHDGSSYFWIAPIRQDKNKDRKVEKYIEEEISIEEDDVSRYLFFFLNKYFDRNFPYICRDEEYRVAFEWNLEHNIYTYADVKKMLEEIKSVSKMLQEDFDNPSLDGVKKYMRLDKEGVTVSEYVSAAVDFYDRFCRRMEAMMENAPQYELISFMGP